MKKTHFSEDKISFYDFIKYTNKSIESLEKDLKSLYKDDLPNYTISKEETPQYEIY